MKRILAISIVLLSTLTLSAQSVTEARAIRTTALLVYDRYVNLMGRLHDGTSSNEDNFLDLFAPGKDSLYNDILPNDRPRYLGAEGYFSNYIENITNATFSYSNFLIGNPRARGKQWSVDLHFSRTVNYVTRDIRYPSWSFQYTMRIVMDRTQNNDKVFDNAKIVSISVEDPFQNCVVVVNPERIPLKWQGRLIYDYDPQCNCWMEDMGRSDINSIQSNVDNSFNGLQVSHKGTAHFYSRQRYDLIGGGIAFAPFGFGNTLDDKFPDIKGSNNAFRVGGFYGLNLLSDDHNAGFLNIGIELTYKHFSYDGFFQAQIDTVDSDLDTYTRNIKGDLIDESWNSLAITVPVTFSYLFNLTPGAKNHLYLSAEAGLYASFRALQSCSYQLSARYTGTYPQYWGIEMDHYYDYGDARLDEGKVEPDKGLRKFDVGATLGIGLWYELNPQAFLRLDISARKGFVSETEYLDDYVLSYSANDYTPVLRSSDNGLFDTYIGLSFIYLRPVKK